MKEAIEAAKKLTEQRKFAKANELLWDIILEYQEENEELKDTTTFYDWYKEYCHFRLASSGQPDCACDEKGSFDSTQLKKCTIENCLPIKKLITENQLKDSTNVKNAK